MLGNDKKSASSAEFGCDTVVEALIREHLTKKQLTSTLLALQQEQGPLQQTINKRSILQEILGELPPPAAEVLPGQQLKKQSVLELLVQQQLLAQHAGQGHTISSCNSRQSAVASEAKATSVSQQSDAAALAEAQPPQQQQTWQRRLQPMSMERATQQHGQQMLVSSPNSSKVSTRGGVVSAIALNAGHGAQAAAGLGQQMEELVICDVELEEGEDHQPALNLKQPTATATAAGAGAAATLGPWLRTPSGSSSICSLARSAQSSSGGGSSSGCFQPLPPEQQRQLVQLVWGEAGVHPEAAWQQGLIWSNVPGLEWGLTQVSGGPCGVLAAVQAHLIATLMEQQLWRPTNGSLADRSSYSSSAPPAASTTGATAAAAGQQPTAGQLQEALISSLALLLWTCATSGDGTPCNSSSNSSSIGRGGCSSSSSSSSSATSRRAAAVVTLPQCGGSSAALRGLCDVGQVLRGAQVATALSLQELEALVRAVLSQWAAHKGWGVLLLVYSALLSRGCAGVRSDMDNETRFVDSLGYCSMELVNLLLTGAAVSNVFDGCHAFGEAPGDPAAAGSAAVGSPAAGAGSLAGAGGDELVLRGVVQRSRVGLLTLFEWYHYVDVGQNLKSPRFPVWVVCSESHFSVLALSSSSSGARQQQVDTAVLQPSAATPLWMQYYDGLAKQEGPIVLQLQPARRGEGWSSRLDGVSEERGVWQGRPIPPLECVLETKWPDTSVVWHGDPIL